MPHKHPLPVDHLDVCPSPKSHEGFQSSSVFFWELYFLISKFMFSLIYRENLIIIRKVNAVPVILFGQKANNCCKKCPNQKGNDDF